MTANYHRVPAGISEAAFQSRITGLCDLLGLKWHHETDSRRTRKGWPDLFICGRHRVLIVEVKKDAKAKVTPEQQEWIDALDVAGQDVRVWRPRDWESQEIQQTLHNLAGRRYFDPDPTSVLGGG